MFNRRLSYCHCHRPGDAGHGPYYRLTRKVDGKTVTETFSSPASLAKAQREVAEYHRKSRDHNRENHDDPMDRKEGIIGLWSIKLLTRKEKTRVGSTAGKSVASRVLYIGN